MNKSKKMYELVELWLGSGKTQREYVKDLDITKDSFSYWVNKYRREFGKDNKTDGTVHKNRSKEYSFIQVSSEPAPTTKVKTPQAEIKLPGGIHIIVY
ncbi:MAG: hypothetical protein SNJ71_01380 [Bacteroidales bacterium]